MGTRTVSFDEAFPAQPEADICPILLPVSVYKKLAEEARRRDLSVAQLLAAALDQYLASPPK